MVRTMQPMEALPYPGIGLTLAYPNNAFSLDYGNSVATPLLAVTLAWDGSRREDSPGGTATSASE